MSTISGAARSGIAGGSLRSTTCSGRGPYRRVRSGGGAGRSRTLVTGSSGQARGGPADDGRGVDTGRERPESVPPGSRAAVVGQPGRGERIGHGGVAVPHEQGALKNEGHGLGQLAGAGFGRITDLLAQ